jgi:hypothetical protein
MAEYAFEMALHGPPIGEPEAFVEERVPAAVERHLATLGVDPEVFVAEHGAPARERAEQRKAEHDRKPPAFPW